MQVRAMLANEPVVLAEGLAKSYRVFSSPWERLREALTRRRRHREFLALEGVDFQLARGEGLALVGENGAGKSTLLKILAGITSPTHGRYRVNGRIASILELGSGFHPEFSGRQNIVLNAALLGLSEAEVADKMDTIIAFSELGGFIDQPVKTYSTGMAMRLGFSIATQVEPEILIIDEALSVGDGYFQKKCIDRLQSFVGGGGTLLFCSHAMYYVTAFCNRALWLKEGRVEALGAVDSVVREYENYLVAKAASSSEEEGEGVAPMARHAAGPGPARITAVEISGASSDVGKEPASSHRVLGDALDIAVEWASSEADRAYHLGIGINRRDGIEVCALGTLGDGLPAFSGRHEYRAILRLPEIPFVKGEFMLYVFLLDELGLHVYDQKLVKPAFTVEAPEYRFGLVDIAHHWETSPVIPAAVGARR
ncbi:MAG: ABC transporter ATP-binding protein [Acidobacteriota bacterium]